MQQRIVPGQVDEDLIALDRLDLTVGDRRLGVDHDLFAREILDRRRLVLIIVVAPERPERCHHENGGYWSSRCHLSPPETGSTARVPVEDSVDERS